MSDNWVVDAQPHLLASVSYNADGLVPVIAQDDSTKDVLMLAWMDEHALRLTLEEGRVTYFSRSRREYWRKGDTSGHIQTALRAEIDCDGDTILLWVEQHGPACHLGTRRCFDSREPV